MPLWKDKTSLHISASELKVGDRGRGWGADIPLPPDLKSRRSSKARLREELKWEDLGMHCLSFPPRLSLYPLPNLKKKKKKSSRHLTQSLASCLLIHTIRVRIRATASSPPPFGSPVGADRHECAENSICNLLKIKMNISCTASTNSS